MTAHARGATASNVSFTVLASEDFEGQLDALARLLDVVVDAGANIGWLKPFSRAEAREHWSEYRSAVLAGTTTIFVAKHGKDIIGCTLLKNAWQPDATQRAEIGKVFVDPAYRRQGVADELLHMAEQQARKLGRWTLHLDTCTGSPAEPLYERHGFKRIGTLPDCGYHHDGSGRLVSVTFWYKDLRQSA